MTEEAICPDHGHPQLFEPVDEVQIRAEFAIMAEAMGMADSLRSARIEFSPEVGKRHRKDPRAYAEVQTGGIPVFRFAPQARSLPIRHRLALIAHELGHLLDPPATENGADAAAEAALQRWGLSIVYDPRWPGKGLQKLVELCPGDLDRMLSAAGRIAGA